MGLYEPDTFSLWLMPDGEAFIRLAEEIDALAQRYKTPAFEPHVTLLGSVRRNSGDIVGDVRSLARQLRPMSIRIEHIESYEQYFRCLYLSVAKSRRIQEARRRACALFDRDEPYRPHLSLMYGEIGKDVIRTLKREIGAGFRGMRFMVRQIGLYKTQGAVESWRPAGKFVLGDLISTDP